MNKWTIKRNKVDINKLAKLANISNVSTTILANRNILDINEIKNFLNPCTENMHDTLLMKDMKKGLEFIVDSIKENKKIAIYGDYDADGIMSTVILYKALNRCKANVIYYIPDRETEGYGMNIESIHKLYNLNVNVILACDNGIAAIEEIEEAKKLNIDVVIIDHHDVRFDDKQNQLLPNAYAVVDPKRLDCPYPFKKMCAAGICYKFAIELYKIMHIPIDECQRFIEYAAIATICDIVDLIDENRIIVAEGLKLLNKTNDIGLKALIEETNLNDKNIGVYQIGFIIGPCINATGRLEFATTAVKLFISNDEQEVHDLATKLVNLNDLRKDMTLEAFEKAIETVEKSDLKNDKVLVVYDENVHESVAGIVAGKIKEYFYLPTIVLTKGEKMAKGSARSIEEYNIFEELCKCSDLFYKFGGHPMAAGMSLEYKNIDILRKRLNDMCKLTDEDVIPKIRIDFKLPLDYISFELVNEINRLAPFGKGNEAPIFAEKNIPIYRVDFIGKDQRTIRMKCISNSRKLITAIFFDGYENFEQLIVENYGIKAFKTILSGKPFDLNLDIAYTININEFNGNKTLQMLIKDFRIPLNNKN